MRKCIVLGCPNSKLYFPDKTFFKFPLKNEELCQIWVKNIGRRSFKPNSASIVCSDHFLESSYDVCPFTKRKKLKQGSFPINFNPPPKPRPPPHCVLLSAATNENKPQPDKSQGFIPDGVPSFLPASTSSQPPNYSEIPQDNGTIIIPRLQPQQEQQCVQISTIQPPNDQLILQNPNCAPVLLNNSMFILPVNVNQAPAAPFTYESSSGHEWCFLTQTAVPSICCQLAPKPDIHVGQRVSQGPSLYESRNGGKGRLLKQTAVPSTSRRLAPKPDANAEKVESQVYAPELDINDETRESQAGLETESQNVTETSVVVNQEPVSPLPSTKNHQEPVKSADKPPILVIKKTASSSSISLLSSTNSSSTYGSAPFPGRPLPLASRHSTNVAEMSIDSEQRPAEAAAAPLPDFAHSSPTNIVEMSSEIKQEQFESAAAPLHDSVIPDMLISVCPNSSNVAEMSTDIKEEPVESAAAPLHDSVIPDMLISACPNSSNAAEMSIDIKDEPIESAAAPLPDMLRSPNSTDVAEASVAIKQEPIESAAAPISECIFPDLAHSSSNNVGNASAAIKRGSVESIDESPQLVSKKIHLVEEMASSSNTFLPTISSSFSISSSTSSSSPSISSSYSISTSSSDSSSSCSSGASSPQRVSCFASPDSTNVDEPPIYIPNKPINKKRVIFLKLSDPGSTQGKPRIRLKPVTPSKPEVTPKKPSEGTSRTSQADLRWRTLMSMASKNSEVPSPKTSGGSSSEPAGKNSENVSKEMLQSLLHVSESNPSFGARSAERTGDLFDVFADFVAEKLRRMDLDDCAHALRAIVDIVSEPDEVHQDS